MNPQGRLPVHAGGQMKGWVDRLIAVDCAAHHLAGLTNSA